MRRWGGLCACTVQYNKLYLSGFPKMRVECFCVTAWRNNPCRGELVVQMTVFFYIKIEQHRGGKCSVWWFELWSPCLLFRNREVCNIEEKKKAVLWISVGNLPPLFTFVFFLCFVLYFCILLNDCQKTMVCSTKKWFLSACFCTIKLFRMEGGLSINTTGPWLYKNRRRG